MVINKRISYHDLKSIEDVIPLRISIVDEGANGLPFEVVDYLTYINKKSDKMTDENKKFSLSDIKDLFTLKKEIQDEVIINKAEEEPEPAPVVEADKSIDALFEKVDMLIAAVDEIKQALATDIEKAEEDKEEEETAEKKDEEEIEKAESEEKPKEEEETTEEKPKEEEEETKIEKSTMKPHDIPTEPETVSNFFTRTNRDALGRKIKN